MSRFSRRSSKATRLRRNNVGRLQPERLEARVVLSASPALPPMAEFQVDPSQYDPESLLVRFRDQASFALDQVDGHLQKSAGNAGSATGLRHLGDAWYSAELAPGLALHDALAAYRGDANVVYAEPNYRLHIAQLPNDPRQGEMWPLENTGQTGGTVDADIDADWAWDVTTGSGNTIVAVIDTGVDYNHPDLVSNMWVNSGEIPGDGIDNDGNQYVDDVYGYDFINHDGDPMDDQGHGTHVAGTIGASGNNGVGISGINWNVQLMALKFLGADGSGTTEDAIEAIFYARDNGADVINASWGGDPYSQALYDAIATTADADQVFVAASGNGDVFGIGINNDANPFYPSGYDLPNIIAVGATNHDDSIATFSNYGTTTVDLAAPGVNILSTTIGGNYGLNSGTSMATPHVAGVTALVRDLHPTWTAVETIQQILATVDPLPGLQGIVATGGRLNAAAAVGNPTPPPEPPAPATLPMFEDFSDGQSSFVPQSGNWSVSSQTYTTAPATENNDFVSLSTLSLADPLPADVEFRSVMRADQGFSSVLGIVLSDHLSNSYLVYDFVDVDNYKFAGADMDADRWVYGKKANGAWSIDGQTPATLEPNISYEVRLRIENGKQLTFIADGVEQLSWQHPTSVTENTIGFAAKDSTSYFDHVLVQAYTPPVSTTLPMSDDFEDGLAENFISERGHWFVDAGRYRAIPAAYQDSFSSIQVDGQLPTDLEVLATINASDVSLGRLSNAFVIFDYQSPTNFKFAGAYAGVDRWLIGERTSVDWIEYATLDATISADTDYDLTVRLQDQTATLTVNGVPQLSHTFLDPLQDGSVGLGTKNAEARFDDVHVRPYTAPVPPPLTALPVVEDFNDGVADHFYVQSGTWTVESARYRVSPELDQDGVSTLRIEDPLPAQLEIFATINADAVTPNRFSNGFVIFDYQGPTDFKFAGAYVASDRWLMGRRTDAGWVEDATFNENLSAWTDYPLQVFLDGDRASLAVDGVTKLSYTFGDSLLDGTVGVGTRDAFANFDDVQVRPYVAPPSTTLPFAEDFNDGVSDFFDVRDGGWSVEGGRYRVVPVLDQDGVSTVRLETPLPTSLSIQATINADELTTNRYSNAFVIFDYQGPNDFKFAGAYTASDMWLIGRRTATGWITDTSVTESISPFQDYGLEVRLEADQVTLLVDGEVKLSRTYSGDALTNGQVGVGTRDALSYFDNIQIHEYVPPPPAPSASLPMTEDFADGVADFLDARQGTWTVPSGRYHAVPEINGDSVSTVRLADALPAQVEILATINAQDVSTGRLSNAMIIFDYQGPLDFKFAGAYVGANRWLIGQRTASGWLEYTSLNAQINAWNDYDLQVVLDGSKASLLVNGEATLSYAFTGSLQDGDVGVGTRNALADFDNIQVRSYTPPPSASLPLFEDFSDGVADFFDVLSGDWSVNAGRYDVVPVLDQDGVSTLNLPQPLPTDLQLSATINADDVTLNRFSNGFLIFDYQSPTNFKFAGTYVASNMWLIGRRSVTGWITDAFVSESILPYTDYDVSITLASNQVRFMANGVQKLVYQYADILTDGAVGVGTRDALTSFDNVEVLDLTPQTLSVAGMNQIQNDSGSDANATNDPTPQPTPGLLANVRRQNAMAVDAVLDGLLVAAANATHSAWSDAAEELFADFDDDNLPALLNDLD